MGYRNIPLEIRQEYGEPLSEVIKSFARMGYSLGVTAEAMEISEWALRKWVKRLELRHLFVRKNYNASCRFHARGYSAIRPTRYSDEELLRQVVACRFKYNLAREYKSGPSPGAITGRFGSWDNAKQKAKEMKDGRINKN
jgi:hypothetical protein